ncbi:MAG: hypothetical protein QOE13_2478 [Gaiellaceae bacterium]|nr:hypothetical protein [Gaiellaceae bacterium]
MAALVFALADLAVIISAAALVVLLRIEDPVDRLLCGFTLAVAQIELSLLFAGVVLHALSGLVVLLLNGVVAALCVIGGRKGLRAARPGQIDVRPLAAAARSAPLTAVLVCLAGAALAWRFVVALVLPLYGFDALSYHVPDIVSWIQTHRVGDSPLNACCTHYPVAGELLLAWPAVLLRSDALVDSVQIGFAVAAAVAVGGIGRAAGFSASKAVSAGALFALTPILVAQAGVAYVDVIFCSTFLLTSYFLFRAQVSEERATALTAVAGLAGGICLGSKPNGVGAVAILTALLVAHLARMTRRGRLHPRKAAARIAVFVLLVSLIGGGWYTRNWVRYGNPVHPIEVRVHGVRIFDGDRRLDSVLTAPAVDDRRYGIALAPVLTWSHDLAFWRRRIYRHDERRGGLGPLWSYLGAPLVLPFAVIAYRRRRPLLAWVIAPIGLLFIVDPYRWWSRFTIALAALGALAISDFLWSKGHRVAIPALRVVTVALAAAGLAFTCSAVSAGSQKNLIRADRVMRLARAPGAHRTYGSLFLPDYKWIDDLGSPARIAFDATAIHAISPLAGTHFQHRLFALRLGDLPGALAENRIDLLLVRHATRMEHWAMRHPTLVTPSREGRHLRVYRVIRAP